ncbi:hypothetical protein [Streptomyces sp. ISL-96]|uniref:hypothetical protein n=1 Tax=Streptomyces sp. ISL-96 TaxID=2819191 RepID=UPI0020361A09|nr:hypothetical protein [Streptomyces sp. ISL-96]
MALFDAAARGDVDSSASADVLLRQVVVLAHASDLLADRSASGDDHSVGRVARGTRPRSRHHDQM